MRSSMCATTVAMTLLFFLFGGSSSAEVRAHLTTDEMLLRSDAIIFATVTSVVQSSDDLEAADVRLGDLRVVASRYPLDPRRLDLRVAGTVWAPDGTPSVRVLRTRPILREGQRYLFFLHGGAWLRGPFVEQIQPIYAVDDQDQLRCLGGGEVYGLGPIGFICGTSMEMAGRPLTEPDAARILAESRRRAERSFPARAAVYDSAVRPIVLTRRTP